VFFKQLQKRCKTLKTSPSAVALKIGLSKANVTHWKNGRMPTGDVISKLADELDCTTDYLLGKTDNPLPLGEQLEEQEEKAPDWYLELVRYGLEKLTDRPVTKEKADKFLELYETFSKEIQK
jgi:transcriptional regulator with XRE-family HTH domain